jgi:hypothetical protein
MLVLALAPAPVRGGPANAAKMDHESMSSKISATSSGSGVRGGARGTVILSDLRTEGVVVVVPGRGRSSAWRRRGKVGSSWGCGPGSAGRGLLILLRGPLAEAREGASGRASLHAPEPEGVQGVARETTWESSRAHHDISSLSVLSASRSASMNSSAVAELALGAVVDLLITSGWICTRCAAGALRSCSCGLVLGLRLRPGHSSSSDVSGVVGVSLLEQAEMLVSKGVGERERGQGGDFCR